MHALQVLKQGDFFIFLFRANAFLHHMIRNVMGALVYIGEGRQPVEWMDFLLAQKDRRLAAPTFSPAGLYLAHVEYPEPYCFPVLDPYPALQRHLGLNALAGQEL